MANAASVENRSTGEEIPGWRGRIGEVTAEGADGLLYDVNLRQVIARGRMDPEQASVTETLSALMCASKAMREQLEQGVAEFGISHHQFKAMMWIRDCGAAGSQLHTIARWLGVTPRNITAVIDTLEVQGLVERVPDPRDRRAVIARLTEAGEQRVMAAKRAHMKTVRQLMSGLSDTEKATLRHISLKLIRAMGPGPLATRPAGAGRSKTDG